jgi:tetratricopeptide (TPR) repeat protein
VYWPLWALSLLAVVVLTTSSGCAGLGSVSPDNFGAERKKRNAETAQRLAQRQDFAEFEAALACWNQQDAMGCRERLELLLGRSPNHRDAQLLMADVLVAEKKPKEALSQVEKVLRSHANDADAHYAMALLLDSSGRNSEALTHYERAAELAPENEVYAVGLRTARDPKGKPAKGSTVGPLEEDDAAWGKFPPGQSGQSTQSEQDPKSAAPTRKLADRSRGSTVEMTALTVSEHSAGKSGPSLVDQGRKALAEGSPQTALAKFRKAAADDPDNPQILISAASAALEHNQPALAVELLRPAVEDRSPSSGRGRPSACAAAHRVLGAAYYRVGEYRLAQTALQQALSLDKSHALSYFLLGCTLAKLGEADAAGVNFRQAQALDPRYAVER